MSVRIKGRMIGHGQPCFVVAEIGINHNGDIKNAFKLIDIATKAGCDAVKFQKRTVAVVYTPEELAKPRQVDQSILQAAIERGVLSTDAVERLTNSDFRNSTNGDLKIALEFTGQEYRSIDRYCAECNILWTVSPWDIQAVEDVRGFGLPFVKVASACLTDDDLLRKIRTLDAPVILATGMSTMEEVEHAIDVLGRKDLVIMQTTSTYPADEKDLNLRVIKTFMMKFPDIPIGYSGHEKGTTLSVCAVALGACIVERHITIDRTMAGSDHAASLEPEGIGRVVGNIRRLESSLGSDEKILLEIEKPVRAKLRRVFSTVGH